MSMPPMLTIMDIMRIMMPPPTASSENFQSNPAPATACRGRLTLGCPRSPPLDLMEAQVRLGEGRQLWHFAWGLAVSL